MTLDKPGLARDAMSRAYRVRRDAGYGFNVPLCVYDLAESMGVDVWFKAIPRMEGMYVKSPGPTVVISSLRPPGRQAYTGGHELGHHVYGHGSRIDEITDGMRPEDVEEEFLAECFGGFPRRWTYFSRSPVASCSRRSVRRAFGSVNPWYSPVRTRTRPRAGGRAALGPAGQAAHGRARAGRLAAGAGEVRRTAAGRGGPLPGAVYRGGTGRRAARLAPVEAVCPGPGAAGGPVRHPTTGVTGVTCGRPGRVGDSFLSFHTHPVKRIPRNETHP